VAELARAKSPQAIERLLEIGLHGKGTASVLALREILDRGLGKPAASVALAVSRAPDANAVGGAPDAARRRIEELIAASETASRDEQSGASPVGTIESGNDVRALPLVAHPRPGGGGQVEAEEPLASPREAEARR
jgi:hypothetical protein